jgi:hypothetical protein
MRWPLSHATGALCPAPASPAHPARAARSAAVPRPATAAPPDRIREPLCVPESARARPSAAAGAGVRRTPAACPRWWAAGRTQRRVAGRRAGRRASRRPRRSARGRRRRRLTRRPGRGSSVGSPWWRWPAAAGDRLSAAHRGLLCAHTAPAVPSGQYRCRTHSTSSGCAWANSRKKKPPKERYQQVRARDGRARQQRVQLDRRDSSRAGLRHGVAAARQPGLHLRPAVERSWAGAVSRSRGCMIEAAAGEPDGAYSRSTVVITARRLESTISAASPAASRFQSGTPVSHPSPQSLPVSTLGRSALLDCGRTLYM